MGRVKCELVLAEINTVFGAQVIVYGPRKRGKRVVCYYNVIPTKDGIRIEPDPFEQCDIKNQDKVTSLIADFVAERRNIIETVFEFFENLTRKSGYRGNVYVTFNFRSKKLRMEIPCTDIE